MFRRKPDSFTLFLGAFGPLSVLFGGSIIQFRQNESPSYRLLDQHAGRFYRNRNVIPRDRRPQLRRKLMFK